MVDWREILCRIQHRILAKDIMCMPSRQIGASKNDINKSFPSLTPPILEYSLICSSLPLCKWGGSEEGRFAVVAGGGW